MQIRIGGRMQILPKQAAELWTTVSGQALQRRETFGNILRIIHLLKRITQALFGVGKRLVKGRSWLGLKRKGLNHLVENTGAVQILFARVGA